MLRVVRQSLCARGSFQLQAKLRVAQQKALLLPLTPQQHHRRVLGVRWCGEFLSPKERQITEILKKGLDAQEVRVADISGGCGAMYEVYVASRKFGGKKLVEQHKAITDLLKEEITQMHGLRITTKALPD